MVLILGLLAVGLWLVVRRRGRRHPAGPGVRRARGVLAVAAILGLQMFVLAPQAMAAECTEPPIPERPGAGMVGAIDPVAPDKGDLLNDTNYSKYSYAGTVWNVYDDNCVLSKSVTDPEATIDTWAGNQMFNIGKNIVGATNGLHYAMLSNNSMLAPLDDAVEQGARTFYDNVYVRWFALAAVVLAVLLFRQIWRGDLATIGRRGMWALGGMWLAASALAIGPVYSQVDSLLLEQTSEIQGGFLPADSDERHALPESLYDNVIYTNWLRGEFGDPDSEKAKRFGPELLAAQAWTVDEMPSADNQARIEEKQNQYRALPDKLGSSAGFFKGTDGSRTGAGFLAMFQGFAYSLFPLLAKAAVLLAQVLLRVLLLGAPLIGLAAMVSPTLLPKVARVAGAVLLSVLMLSALAGMHALLLNLIFATRSELSLLAQILLATLLTVIFLMIGRPIRRMRQMVELSVGSIGVGTSSAGAGIFNRFRRNSGGDTETPQDRFWSTVRGGDTDSVPAEQGGGQTGRRVRPEASTMSASAQRLDRRNAQIGGQPPGTVPAGVAPGREGVRALPPSPNGYSGPSVALRESGHSRTVDSPSVVEGRWEREPEPVIVPSTVVNADGSSRRDDPDAPLPRSVRKAETEMVGGRAVHVLYRPSGGFEMRDNERWDNPRTPAR